MCMFCVAEETFKKATWNRKHPCIHDCFNGMIPNLDMRNSWFIKHPLKNRLFSVNPGFCHPHPACDSVPSENAMWADELTRCALLVRSICVDATKVGPFCRWFFNGVSYGSPYLTMAVGIYGDKRLIITHINGVMTLLTAVLDWYLDVSKS